MILNTKYVRYNIRIYFVSEAMENKLLSLKENFNKIMDIRSNIEEIFEVLHMKMVKLQKMHGDFMTVCKTQLFVFGLDSFHFQNKIIDIEYEDMMRYFLAINNRMYCEYFKLYRIVVDYIHKNTKDTKMLEVAKLNKFPPYKDLEPFKEYKMSVLMELHESLIALLSSMISYVHNKEHELGIHESKLNIGINIDNFVSTFNYTISIMREKISLFIKYMEFFHVLHTKYLQRFSNKIQLMYTHINNDIHLDGNLSSSTIGNIMGDTIANVVIPTDYAENHTNVENTSSDENSNTILDVLSTDDAPTTTTTTTLVPRPFQMFRNKSVNDILKESIHGSMSKSESRDEDIVVYNVFSSIESKCSSIRPTITTAATTIPDAVTITDTNPITVIPEETLTIPEPKKRRGRKKKSEV